jgi:hypothetical protein
MTIAEIDAHPDADRIWATIAAMQKHVKDEIERQREEIEIEAYNDGLTECAKSLEYNIEFLMDKHADKISPELKTAIEELDCTP